ncbi:hypothetical protein [Prauserella flavalba]|uniref:Antibiotic biosynthesis monooxygenase n=1 Tax=Prauserella flavalba TaxID=1477506 RepID=A0A318LNN2_9PSEU|nr:hypothetical protein [Prauserella flavalba]PXY36196.1 hypothetical protein BA062_12220 [Prauserella flavalba]
MTAALPVTVLVSRTARTDGAALLRWAHGLCQDAARFPGHLASHVGTAETGGSVTVHIGVSFACSADLARWERSDARARRLAEGDRLTRGEPVALSLADLGPAGAPPAGGRLRSAILIWVALFPPAAAVNALLIPYLDAWPGLARTLVLTLVLVPVVVFGTLPPLQRALARRSRPR